MSLFDNESEASKALRRLVIGGRQDELDLTLDDSPFTIDHKPSSRTEYTRMVPRGKDNRGSTSRSVRSARLRERINIGLA